MLFWGILLKYVIIFKGRYEAQAKLAIVDMCHKVVSCKNGSITSMMIVTVIHRW